jgi:hypothetical protein
MAQVAIVIPAQEHNTKTILYTKPKRNINNNKSFIL